MTRTQRLHTTFMAAIPLAAASLPPMTAAAQLQPWTQQHFEGYLDNDALAARLQSIAGSNANVSVAQLALSRGGRAIHVLTLSSDVRTAGERPALLITAGIDGRHLVGTETAVRVAENILANHADLLEAMTIYIIPRVNPDAVMKNLGAVNAGYIGVDRPVDDDRDRATDEDGPVDLNGDGVITMMRQLNPPLGTEATHLPDPGEPRLMKTPDAMKGEVAAYAMYIEGLDQDGDGEIAEDGPGMVDLDRNFMHRWPQYANDAGPYQLSESESHALAQFVIEHPNIVMAVTFGRHDNLVHVPDGRGRDITGEAPLELDGGDVDLYKKVAELFKETTAQERAPKDDDVAGSFHAWLYAQRGLPSFATIVWGRPDPSKEEPKPEEPAEGEGDPAAAGETKPAEQPEEKKEKKDAPKPADEEAAAWLTYSDRDRNGAGFVEWQPFDHPTLGQVEIGGFVPGFMMNPPVDQLDDLAAKQTDFIVELVSKRPMLREVGPTVARLAPGLYEVRFAIVNDGFMPTTTMMARRARSVPPTVVRMKLPIEQIVSGEPMSQSWGIDGSGGRFEHHWIIRVEDGREVEIEIANVQHGSKTIRFRAE